MDRARTPHPTAAAGLVPPLIALALLSPALLGAARTAAAQEPDEPGGLAFPGPLVSAVEDLSRSGLAFVALEAARDTWLIGEPIELRLVFGLERTFLRENLVQLFPRPLDVPVQLFVPAFEPREGLRVRAAADPSAGATVALGETIVRAERTGERERDGRTYATFALTRTAVATRAGVLELDPPALTCAFAREFGEDLLHGRQPRERLAARARGSARRLVVQPLPEADRPDGFTGAIGRVRLQASAAPLELAAGQGLELVLVIEAEGELHDLSRCEPPDLAALPGFHLRGQALEREPARLVARYDLVPERAGELEIPAIPFASFDLEPPAGYRTVASDPIRVRVHPPEAPPEAPARARAPGAPAPTRAPTFLVVLVVLVTLAGLALIVVVARRRRRRARVPPR